MSNESSEQQSFTPWRRGFLYSSVLLTIGVGLLLLSIRVQPINYPTLLVSIVVLGLGALWFKTSFTRWNGKHVEKSSIKGLRFPDGWTVTPNYMLKGHGDIDLHLQAPDGSTYAVEIKSVQNVQVKAAFLFLGPGSLVRSDGKKIADDPIPQTLKNAKAVDAVPVLWFPKAQKSGVSKLRGVTVVLGGRRHLYKAVGCRFRGLWPF